ncbi:MAG: DUF4062 domain-containing protein [Desulfobacter sp.]|nr:MAG: DUF4062 domain-containing protein [Desulfobacter sp.]
MARIYVSSTFSDLEAHRKEVCLALKRLGHEDVAMEYYVAEDKRPVDRCLEDVASCDVYVGIFAYRYGFVPIKNNPHGYSITEMEYRKALETHIPCLMFLMSEEAPWPKNKQDKGAAAQKIESFREEIINGERHMVNFFETADGLARQVNEAIVNWEKETGVQTKRQATDWDRYRQAVGDKHQWVRLQVIAGAGKHGGIAKIPLTDVFEPQLAAHGISPKDIPDEIREYQKIIYGSRHGEGEPDGKTPDSGLEPDWEDPMYGSNPEMVLDLLAKEPAQVILGGPGSGKTTILHYAMLRMCRRGTGASPLPLHLDNAPVPFLIELRKYVLHGAEDFIQYIIRNTKEFYDVTIDGESLVALLEEKKRALVFFDGLDEVFDPDQRISVINQFENFANRYPGACIIVTSRIAGYSGYELGLAGFSHYTLLPLTLNQIRNFTLQWYRYYTLEGTERTAQGLVQRITESPRLLDLAGNPLLLTMMAVIYKDRDLPNERWRLYKRCADTLLEDWEMGKGIKNIEFRSDVQIRTAQKAEILQRVARYMLGHGQENRELNAIAYAPLYTIVSDYLRKKYSLSQGIAEAVTIDILQHLMERTYVLAGIGERVFGFVHRTFMEYFAALDCQAQFNAKMSDFTWLTREIFGAHWQGGEWEEVLLLLIAMLQDQGTPIRDVVEYLRTQCRRPIPFNRAFAVRCLGETGSIEDLDYGRKLLEELASDISEHAPQFRKKESARFLEEGLKAFSALAPLVPVSHKLQKTIDALNRRKEATARMAAWQMGFALQPHKERLDYALKALNDKEEVIRRGAITAIEREWPGRADIGPIMAEIVRSDRLGRVRQAAMYAMQRSWSREPAILDAISRRIDMETGYTYVIKYIEYLAKNWGGNPRARDIAVNAVAQKTKAREDYDVNQVKNALISALGQGWSEDPEAFGFLQNMARHDPLFTIRLNALGAIVKGWECRSPVLSFLDTLVADERSPDTRGDIIAAIIENWNGDPQLLAFIKEKMKNDVEPAIRAMGMEFLSYAIWGRCVNYHSDTSKINEAKRILPVLYDLMMNDPDISIRERAIFYYSANQKLIIQTTGDRSESPRWMATLEQRAKNDSDIRIRLLAVKEIAEEIHLSSHRSFYKKYWDLRHRSFKLASILDPGQITRGNEFLTAQFDVLHKEASGNPDPEVRAIAIWAIAFGWHNEAELGFLKRCAVEDPAPQTRINSLLAMALVWRHKNKVRNFLIKRSTKDPEKENRNFIKLILQKPHNDIWDLRTFISQNNYYVPLLT